MKSDVLEDSVMVRQQSTGIKGYIHSTQIHLLEKELTVVIVIVSVIVVAVLCLVSVWREKAEGCCLAVGVLNTSFLALLQGEVLFVVVGLPLVFIVSQLLKSDITWNRGEFINFSEKIRSGREHQGVPSLWSTSVFVSAGPCPGPPWPQVTIIAKQ